MLPSPAHGGGAGGGGFSRLASLRADFALYATLIRAQVNAQLQYRTSFAFQTVSQFIITFTDFIMLLMLFHQFPSIAGWTLPEVAFLYGLGGVAFGFSDLLCGGFDNLSKMIRLGTFDRVLTRPVGTFAQVLNQRAERGGFQFGAGRIVEWHGLPQSVAEVRPSNS